MDLCASCVNLLGVEWWPVAIFERDFGFLSWDDTTMFD